MTELEIDKALALAIGWKEHTVVTLHLSSKVLVRFGVTEEFPNGWRVFSHKDWNVIGPIAARFNCFPFEDAFGRWFSDVGTNGKKVGSYTPQKAIALAVIGAKRGTKT